MNLRSLNKKLWGFLKYLIPWSPISLNQNLPELIRKLLSLALRFQKISACIVLDNFQQILLWPRVVQTIVQWSSNMMASKFKRHFTMKHLRSSTQWLKLMDFYSQAIQKVSSWFGTIFLVNVLSKQSVRLKIQWQQWFTSRILSYFGYLLWTEICCFSESTQILLPLNSWTK